MNRCPHCKAKLLTDHSFCPTCGFDLRKNEVVSSNEAVPDIEIDTVASTEVMEAPNETLFIDKLNTPSYSLLISFLVGVVVQIYCGDYRHFGGPDINTAGLIGTIIGAGLVFPIFAAVPTLIISLIVYAFRRKFPSEGFARMIYLLTILLSLLLVIGKKSINN